MALRKATPVRFAPKGLSDAYDSTEAFNGACRNLSNLVFDQSNPELVTCRPGVGTALTTFGSFTSPTFVTVFISIGTVIYGMVGTARNAGHDEPFAYDTATGLFTTISGVTSANTPLTPSTTGAWTPPTMTIVAKKIIVTSVGFSGAGGNFFGVLDISTPSAPTWAGANTATNALPTVPTVVANFFNRAYFACGNVLYFSDALVPTTITNATNQITIGDTTPIISLVGLPVNTLSGGVAQSLMAFKNFSIWQVTGDISVATNPLAINYLSLNVGTPSPRSVVQTPYGTCFAAIDGPYIVDPYGAVRPLTKDIKEFDQDIQAPFIYCQIPSRVAAGYSGGYYRVCLDVLLASTNSVNDYWFDLQRRRWNGPHTWPTDCMAQIGNYFVVSHRTIGAALYKSQLFPDQNTVYNDNGSAITFQLQSSTFPKDARMTEKQVVESTIELSSSGAAVSYNVVALDERGTVLNSVTLLVPANGYIWGAFNWGAGFWSSNLNIPTVYNVNWTSAIVFQKMALQVNGTASNNIAIGSFFARYQDSGYMNARGLLGV